MLSTYVETVLAEVAQLQLLCHAFSEWCPFQRFPSSLITSPFPAASSRQLRLRMVHMALPEYGPARDQYREVALGQASVNQPHTEFSRSNRRNCCNRFIVG